MFIPINQVIFVYFYDQDIFTIRPFQFHIEELYASLTEKPLYFLLHSSVLAPG